LFIFFIQCTGKRKELEHLANWLEASIQGSAGTANGSWTHHLSGPASSYRCVGCSISVRSTFGGPLYISTFGCPLYIGGGGPWYSILLSDAFAFLLYLRMQNQLTSRAHIPSTPRATPTPMPTLAPVLKPPVLEVWDDVDETVDPVLLANDEVLLGKDILVEELVVEDGAKIYPLTWTA